MRLVPDDDDDDAGCLRELKSIANPKGSNQLLLANLPESSQIERANFGWNERASCELLAGEHSICAIQRAKTTATGGRASSEHVLIRKQHAGKFRVLVEQLQSDSFK